MNYYPVFLDLKGRKVVIVGGGRVAARKVRALLKTGADITVISPSMTRTLMRERARKTIRHVPREFAKNDLQGAFLAIAATDSPEINREAAAQAPALINVVDVPAECNFISPSVITRGELTIAISTGGASPALAKTVRRELEMIYGKEITGYLKFLRDMRTKTFSEIGHKGTRERFLKSLASPTLLRTLRSKGLGEVRKTVLSKFRRVREEAVRKGLKGGMA